MEFAEKHIHWRQNWKHIIFSDAKKFNFDGPHGFGYYSHNMWKEEYLLRKRQQEEGGVMEWGGNGYNREMELQFITKQLKSEAYVKMISEQIQTSAKRVAGENDIFQQDNATIHTANIIKRYFSSLKKTSRLSGTFTRSKHY